MSKSTSYKFSFPSYQINKLFQIPIGRNSLKHNQKWGQMSKLTLYSFKLALNRQNGSSNCLAIWLRFQIAVAVHYEEFRDQRLEQYSYELPAVLAEVTNLIQLLVKKFHYKKIFQKIRTNNLLTVFQIRKIGWYKKSRSKYQLASAKKKDFQKFRKVNKIGKISRRSHNL